MNRKRMKKLISILTVIAIFTMSFASAFSVSAEDAVLEPISAETVCAAILSADADSEISVTATQKEGYIDVAITSELLKEHNNAFANPGYWAGFAVVAPEGATHLKYAFGASDEITLGEAYALTDEDVVTADGEKGIAFYADAGSNDAKTYAKLQWFAEGEVAISAETTFLIDLDGIVLDSIEKDGVEIWALDKKSAYVDLYGVQDGDDVSVDFSKIKMEYGYADIDLKTEFDVANVADSNENEAERLASVYDEGSYKVELIDKYEIRITMKNLLMHKNANQADGHWTGFSVKAPEGAKYLTYWKTFGNNSYDYQTITLEEGQTEESFYMNVTECDIIEEIEIQWLDENNFPISDYEWYEIDLSNVEIAAENEVAFETANVCDSFPGENAPAKVYETYEVTEASNTIKIEMEDLVLHRNANKIPGYWTGFKVNAPEGTKYLKYEKNFGNNSGNYQTIIFEDGQTSESFYFDVVNDSNNRRIKFQFLDESNRPLTRIMNYRIDSSDVEIKYPEENTISKANVADFDSDESVYEEYDVACQWNTIELSATNLKAHTNGNSDEGHWIGFSVEAPEGATHYTYDFGNSYENTPVALEDGETSVSFYVNASSPEAKDYLEIRWYCDEDEPENYPYNPAYDYCSYYIDITNVDLADDVDVTVTAANIVNQNALETVPYTGTPESTLEDDGTIKLAVEGLKTHFNGEGKLGAWVGASISRPEGAEYVKYAFNEYAWWSSANYEPADEVADENAISFYVDAYDESPKDTIMLQWFDENEVAISNILTYKLDLSGVNYLVADEAEVSFEKANIVDQSAPETPAYVGKYDVNLEEDTIILSADCIKTHENGEGNDGAWIGFKASVEGAKYLKYVFENDDWYYDWYNAEQIEISGSESFYVDAADYDAKNFVMLQWFDENGNALTNVNTYKIDIEKVTTEDSFPVLFSNIKLTGEDARFYNLVPNDKHVEWVSNVDYVYVLADAAPNGSVELTVEGTDESNGGNVFYRNADRTVTLTATPNSGYVFNGWYDSNGNKVSNIASYEIALDACYELEARFRNRQSDSPRGGGSSSVNYYTVSFNSNGGSVISSAKVKKEDTVSAPTAPIKDGFVFDGWYIDKELTQKYDFSTSVTKSFTLYAKWVESENIGLKFADISKNTWYYDVVKTVVEKGLMNGITETQFAPELEVTRAMFVTILYRAAGEPQVATATNFTDVVADQYYAKAVAWANANGVVKGITETEFSPDNNITREQMAAILHRYAKGETAAGEVTYTDKAAISDYALDAVAWAKATGLMEGNADGTFAPSRNASRAEAAAVFVRLLKF